MSGIPTRVPWCRVRGPALFLALAALALAQAASADLGRVDLDPGDGLLLRDPAGGLDWLRLDASAGLSSDAVRGGAGGWIQRGFRPASGDEVCALFSRYAVAPEPCPGAHVLGSGGGVEDLMDLLGITQATPGTSWSRGLFDDGDARTGLAALGSGPAVAHSRVHGNRVARWKASPHRGHFLVRPHITIYGRPGTFGTLPDVIPASGLPISKVPVAGFSLDAGLTYYYADVASDETLFVSNLYQNPSQFSPTSCSQVISCFNPHAPVCRDPATGQAAHYSNLRVHNFRGEPFTPSGAEGAICDALAFGQARGGEIGDVQVVEVGSEERVVATSMIGSLSPSLLVDDFPPAWITVEKVAGLWEVDQEASLHAGDLRSSSPAGEALCVPGNEPLCTNYTECPEECALGPPLELGDLVLQRCTLECRADRDCPTGFRCGDAGVCLGEDCGGFNELARLPVSGHVVVSLYTGGGLAVLDPDGTPQAVYYHPPTPNPCPTGDPWVAFLARQVNADPLSEPGDERFGVAYDSIGFPGGHLVQEFRYVEATRHEAASLEPTTPAFIPYSSSEPALGCSKGRAHGVRYDREGNLWVASNGPLGTENPVYGWFRDPVSKKRSLEVRCASNDPLSGEQRPVGFDCLADLDVGPPTLPDPSPGARLFGTNFAGLRTAPWSSSLFQFDIRGSVAFATSPVTSSSGAIAYSTSSGVRVNLPGRLPRPAGTAIRVWNAPPNPIRREFYLPVGVLGAGTDVGDLRDNWILRLPVDPLIEATTRVIEADVPARTARAEHIEISLTLDSTDPLVGSASGLYVGKDGGLVAVDEWARVGCSAGSCTYQASIDGTFNESGDPVVWHGILHTRSSGALHVAGIVGP